MTIATLGAICEEVLAGVVEMTGAVEEVGAAGSGAFVSGGGGACLVASSE